MISFFFSYGYGGPRDLHSFPTRRSSDLPASLAKLTKINTFHSELFSYFVAKLDRKSTRLNSSHITISYAVFCLKKKPGARAPVAAPVLVLRASGGLHHGTSHHRAAVRLQ